MARSKKQIVEAVIDETSGTITIPDDYFPSSTVTVSSGMSNFLDQLETEIAGLDGVAAIINAKLIKIRIENLIKKARAELY